ncbi:MAG: VCBS repeat-containing protein [Fuerstiella sp.]|nr:VCBS repeat-containing protein [Fuerstiella sp.]
MQVLNWKPEHIVVVRCLVLTLLLQPVGARESRAVEHSPTLGGEWKKHSIHTGGQTMTAVAADFTGDGRNDIIASSDRKTRLYVAPDWKEIVLANDADHDFLHSEVMDVDGDGDTDYLATRYTPGLIVWFERPANPLTETWPVHLVDDQVNGIHGLIVGDVDGDSTPDLLATSALTEGPFPESLVWLRVPKTPRKAKRWDRYVFADRDAPGLSHYLGFGDVNGDGRPDAASAAKTGNWFAWWEAPANPRKIWTKHLIAENQAGATNIHPVDVDRDGMTDFMASRGHGKGVVWFEAPDWKPHELSDTVAGAHCLTIADLDEDGDIDAATCAGAWLPKEHWQAVWFENDGQGHFSTHVIGRNQTGYDIRSVDMDGDGDPDLLIGGMDSQNVVWYENPLR